MQTAQSGSKAQQQNHPLLKAFALRTEQLGDESVGHPASA
jgi:hypothetical protein